MLYDMDRPHSTESFPAVFTRIQAPGFHGLFDWNTMGIALPYPPVAGDRLFKEQVVTN